MTRPIRLLLGLISILAPGAAAASVAFDASAVTRDQLAIVTTKVPFPRGLVLREGQLYVLARGRVRDYGGADPRLDDLGGTIYKVDPNIAQPVGPTIAPEVANNGVVFAEPTAPPFKLLDRSLASADQDRLTDRPYCVLRFDEATQSFYLCAFSGIDRSGQPSFLKNFSDALFRYDLRTRRWYEVERHNPEALDRYPHHDIATNPPPHGWLKGPDNCLIVGRWLYAVAKDNNVLVKYDLAPLRDDPEAGPPAGRFVLGDRVTLENGQSLELLGHSMLASHDGWLYLGTRTNSQIVRMRIDPASGELVRPIVAQHVATFDPWDPQTRTGADTTDMAIGPDGDVYVVSAKPSRVYRFKPDPLAIFDGRSGKSGPWADLAALTDNPAMKSENVMVDDAGRVFVTSGDAYAHDAGLGGAVYVIRPRPTR